MDRQTEAYMQSADMYVQTTAQQSPARLLGEWAGAFLLATILVRGRQASRRTRRRSVRANK